jgi:hypothetical protein
MRSKEGWSRHLDSEKRKHQQQALSADGRVSEVYNSPNCTTVILAGGLVV